MRKSTVWAPLNDAGWRDWQQKSRSPDSKGTAMRMKAGKWLLFAALPVAVALWFLAGHKIW